MRGALLVVLLAACGGDRRPEARALALYDRGIEQLERGEHAAAAASFAGAAEADPSRPLLRSWQAYALAGGGEVEAAVALLESLPVMLPPHDPYNLAAWCARLGRDERALSHLGQALEADPALRDALRDDPDFAALRASGGLDAELDRELRAVMLGEEGAILAGEQYDLELDIQGREEPGIALRWLEPLPAGFSLGRVVDDLSGEGGEALRTIHYRVRVRRGGDGSLGPWSLLVGSRALEIPAVPWEALLPAGVELGPLSELPPLDERWWTPREALAGLEPPAAEARHGLLVVVTAPGDQVVVDPGGVQGAPLELELRRDDQATLSARAWRWAPEAEAASVRISRAGTPLIERRVARER